MDEMIQEQSSQPAGEKPVLSYKHKVLIVGDTRMHYWAEDLKEAFVHVGATASVLPLVPKRLEERWFEFRKGFMNFDVDEPVIQRIRDQVTQANPQLILFLDPFGMEPAFFKAIQRDLKRSAILAAWFSDCRRTSWKGIQCFNHIFYSDSSMQESLKKVREGEKKGLKYLPLAVNEKRFQPGGVKARKNKIVFAGSLTETRLKILNRLRLRGVPVEWYGPQTHGFWNRLTNQKLDHSDLSRLYQEFAITLNLPRRPKNLNGINFRVFEVAACQNLLLTKWVPDLELQFDPYEEVVVYRDWDEVPLVFRSMMYDPYRAEDIALNGRKRVIQQHTYRHRVQTILTTLGQKAC